MSDLSIRKSTARHYNQWQTLLSTAKTNYYTCLDGFSYSRRKAPINATKFDITVAKDETENYNAIRQVVAIAPNFKYHKLNSLNICNTQA